MKVVYKWVFFISPKCNHWKGFSKIQGMNIKNISDVEWISVFLYFMIIPSIL